MSIEADRVAGTPAPCKLNDNTEIRLVFNMFSASALGNRYNTSSPLVAMGRGVAADAICYILAAGCLHDSSGLPFNRAAVMGKSTTPEKEADRLATQIMAEIRSLDNAAIQQAIVTAYDRTAPIPRCITCDHAFSEHDYLKEPCMVEGCKCEIYRGAAQTWREDVADHLRRALLATPQGQDTVLNPIVALLAQLSVSENGTGPKAETEATSTGEPPTSSPPADGVAASASSG